MKDEKFNLCITNVIFTSNIEGSLSTEIIKLAKPNNDKPTNQFTTNVAVITYPIYCVK